MFLDVLGLMGKSNQFEVSYCKYVTNNLMMLTRDLQMLNDIPSITDTFVSHI